MAGVGPATAGKLEVQLNGSWTDFSAFVAPPVVVTGGRSTAFDPTQPTTLALSLYNDGGNFTPDNPLSPYFPYLIENAPIRYTVTAPSAVTYQIFTGFIDSLTPAFTDVTRESGMVAVAASDGLARINRQPLNSDWVEQVLLYPTLFGYATWAEVWPMGPDARTGQLRNVGTGPGVRRDIQLIIPKHGDIGAYSLGDTVTDRLLDGAVTLSPAASTVTTIVNQGTVPKYSWDGTPQSIYFWFKIPTDSVYPGDNKAVLAQFFNASGYVAGTLFWSGAGTGLTLVDNNGAVSTVVDATDYGGSLKDGGWHLMWVFKGSPVGHSGFGDRLNNIYFDAASTDMTLFRSMTLGGALAATVDPIGTHGPKASPFFCLPGVQFGPVAIFDGTQGLTPDWTLTDPTAGNFTESTANRFADIRRYLLMHGVIAASGSEITASGGSGAVVARNQISGRLAGDVLAELGDTVAGFIFVDPTSGLLNFYDGAGARDPGVGLTIDLAADSGDSAKLIFKRAVDELPTRVSLSSPAGDFLVIDPIAESLGAVRDTSLSVQAATPAVALTAGAWQIVQSKGLRMRGIQLDLAGSPNNNWPVLALLRPFLRVRASNLPTTHLGYTYTDGYVVSYTITLDVDAATIDFDCLPAGLEVRPDTTDAGAGTSATLNAGITASATALAIATTAETFSTSAGNYPLDINLNGERITLGTVPSGGTSPQSFTGLTRGVAPSVARAHAAGEPIECWNVAIVSM